MSLDPDAIVDRRRLRRKLTFWRVSALVILVAAVVAAIAMVVPGTHLLPQPGYIARVHIKGLIRDNQDRVDALAKLAKSSARAVIVHVNSPGGTTAGSQQLYDSLRTLQAAKPMVVVVDGLAASGAYIAALSSEHIVAADTSLVGSIGVLFQYPNFTDALNTLGIKMEFDQIDPAQGGAQRLRADQPGGPRRHPVDRARLLRVVQRSGEDAPQHDRESAFCRRRRPRLHRPPSAAVEAG